MTSLSNGLGWGVDRFLVLFEGWAPWWGLAVMSLVTGALLVFVFKFTSNQSELRKTKDRIKAQFLAILLFKDSFRVLIGCLVRILTSTLRYIRLSLVSMLVAMVPLVLILIQLQFWFGYAPLRTGDSAILTATLDAGVDLDQLEPSLEVPDGLEVETPAVRVPALRELNWRIRAARPGRYTVRVAVSPGDVVEKSVRVGEGMHRVAPRRHQGGFEDALLFPGEAAIPAGSVVERVDVNYRSLPHVLFGWELHWLLVFFVLSMIFGWLLKGPLKVEI